MTVRVSKLPTARRLLVENKGPETNKARIVKQTVSEHFGLTVEQLMQPTRRRRISWRRQIAMAILKDITDFSYPQVGIPFGKDHATVIHACRAVKQRNCACDETAREYDELQARCAAMLMPRFHRHGFLTPVFSSRRSGAGGQ